MPGITKDAALNLYGNASNVQAAVKELVSMAAKYGFIGGGWSTELIYTPTLSKDVEAYVKIILQLGAGGFEERYGEYPLVMQKFNVLRDYIENELLNPIAAQNTVEKIVETYEDLANYPEIGINKEEQTENY